MNPLLNLVRFGSKRQRSHSLLVDLQQLYLRNAILFCSGLSMVRLLFGDAIHCQAHVRAVSQAFVDLACFVNGTVTRRADGETLYHDYYQWVSVYLLLLALAFYAPHSVWQRLCGGYLRQLESLGPLDAIRVVRDSRGHRLFLKTAALEVFYAFYLVPLLLLTDLFFHRRWSRGGWSWRVVPDLFPDDGTCFLDYFQEGGESTGRFRCLLPLCSVYRKVFLALYGMLVALMAANACLLPYRLALTLMKGRGVDAWWALTVAEGCAGSWDARQAIRRERRGPKEGFLWGPESWV